MKKQGWALFFLGFMAVGAGLFFFLNKDFMNKDFMTVPKNMPQKGLTSYDRNTDGLTARGVSSDFPTKEEKILFLKRYIAFKSEVLDTEYAIDYQDSGNFGISIWDIRAALKVAPEELGKWSEGFEPVEVNEILLEWWGQVADLILKGGRDSFWKARSKPLFFKEKGKFTFRVIYPEEGVVLHYSSTFIPSYTQSSSGSPSPASTLFNLN